jgi:hypothetical protein
LLLTSRPLGAPPGDGQKWYLSTACNCSSVGFGIGRAARAAARAYKSITAAPCMMSSFIPLWLHRGATRRVVLLAAAGAASRAYATLPCCGVVYALHSRVTPAT